ncbi:cytochrome b [Pseudomonas sp. JR33AA]|uniref:cytochrome b n=1 Tax=Pseudomonas sp. JR33AA TaxID=2899113 RepID=UPI001F1A1690|nr:cytochrome b/b6 domain-containing protein [Pseudomonas sp. JR33AA]MCE5975631.1 cytochrome b/b6 domain-containing protein [Pseudomonas sp. JR33AA]
MSQDKYAWQQVLLHWISALVIGWALVSGFYVSLVGVQPSRADFIGFVNVGLTTLFIPIFLMRWLLRVFMPRPGTVHQSVAGRRIAHFVHEGLYWLTAVVLLSGVLMMDRPIEVFGWFAIAPLLVDPSWLDAWLKLHIATSTLLAGAMLLHVAAVVLHELSGRRILRRMLP